jgi:hypothetical protein
MLYRIYKDVFFIGNGFGKKIRITPVIDLDGKPSELTEKIIPQLRKLWTTRYTISAFSIFLLWK